MHSVALLYPSNSLHLHPKPPLQHSKTIDRSMHTVCRQKFTFAPKTTFTEFKLIDRSMHTVYRQKFTFAPKTSYITL